MCALLCFLAVYTGRLLLIYIYLYACVSLTMLCCCAVNVIIHTEAHECKGRGACIQIFFQFAIRTHMHLPNATCRVVESCVRQCAYTHTHTHIPHKCVCAYIRTVAVAMVVVVVVVVILAVDVSCTHTQDPSTNRSTCTYMQAHVIFRHTHDIFVIASTNINGWCAGCFKVVAVLLHISFCHCAVYICVCIYI